MDDVWVSAIWDQEMLFVLVKGGLVLTARMCLGRGVAILCWVVCGRKYAPLVDDWIEASSMATIGRVLKRYWSLVMRNLSRHCREFLDSI